jgi:acetate---CoA ligase (ADP-forming)
LRFQAWQVKQYIGQGYTVAIDLLDGIRGQKGYDKKSLKQFIYMCSELIESYPEIEEMDLNPVILYENGLDVVDARIILKKE